MEIDSLSFLLGAISVIVAYILGVGCGFIAAALRYLRDDDINE